ncbi:PilN domain-containing protein [Ideonella margarita]|uniref:PilN domain-containing protein n=1 Tax=Ideonella margarita TaxID=2984191 RepID=A0ABU9C0T1_9BURK
MILINLLPHREARRQERKRAFFSALGLASLVGVGLVVLWFGVLQQMISVQQGRNRYLTEAIKELEERIKDIANLKDEIEALKARQKAVEDLQADRNVPVYLLDELVKQTPEGVYLTNIRQVGSVVTFQGLAQSQERVSEFIRNAAYNSQWLEKPELVEIKATNVTVGKAQRKLFDFSMKVSLKRPQAPAGAASGAVARPPAASAPQAS